MALLETCAPQTRPRETKRQTEQPVVTLPSPDAHARLLFSRPVARCQQVEVSVGGVPPSPQGLEAPAAAARRLFRFVREAAEASVIRDRRLPPPPRAIKSPLDPHRRKATLCPCSVPAGSWPGLTMGGSEAPGQLDEAILKPRAHNHHHHQLHHPLWAATQLPSPTFFFSTGPGVYPRCGIGAVTRALRSGLRRHDQPVGPLWRATFGRARGRHRPRDDSGVLGCLCQWRLSGRGAARCPPCPPRSA
jgi:hypothetical protein